METQVITTLISTAGAVTVGLGGMWISTQQLGKRVDDLIGRINRVEDSLNHLEGIVNSKFSALDLEIGRILDKIK